MRAAQYVRNIFATRTPALYRVVKMIALHTRALLTKSSPEEIIFTTIYRNGGWSGGDGPSGPGSTLEHTRTIRVELPRILRKYRVKTLLDVPCGDFRWMQEIDLERIQYSGADIVQELVEQNRRRFRNAQREFLHVDLVRDPLPRADSILCRDCLPHLPFREIVRALHNIKNSGSSYLFTSDYPNCRENKDIPMGKFRPINLTIPPFDFPPPLEEIDDFDGVNIGKSLGVWRISEIPMHAAGLKGERGLRS